MRVLALMMVPVTLAWLGWWWSDNRRRSRRLEAVNREFSSSSAVGQSLITSRAIENFNHWGAQTRVLQRVLDQDPMLTYIPQDLRDEARAAVTAYYDALLPKTKEEDT